MIFKSYMLRNPARWRGCRSGPKTCLTSPRRRGWGLLVGMEPVVGIRPGLQVGFPVTIGLEGGFGGGESVEVRLGLLLGLAGFPEVLDGFVGVGGNRTETADHRRPLTVFLLLLELGESGGGDFGRDGIRIGGELGIDAGLDFRSDHGVMQF